MSTTITAPKLDVNASKEALLARIAQLEHKANNPTTDGLRVSVKGAVSFYGTGRYPVTLYASGWAKVISLVKSGKLEAFLKANDSKLAKKEE